MASLYVVTARFKWVGHINELYFLWDTLAAPSAKICVCRDKFTANWEFPSDRNLVATCKLPPTILGRHQHCWGMTRQRVIFKPLIITATSLPIHQVRTQKTRVPPQGVASVSWPQARILLPPLFPTMLTYIIRPTKKVFYSAPFDRAVTDTCAGWLPNLLDNFKHQRLG